VAEDKKIKKSCQKIWKLEKKYISLHCKYENINTLNLETILLKL